MLVGATQLGALSYKRFLPYEKLEVRKKDSCLGFFLIWLLKMRGMDFCCRYWNVLPLHEPPTYEVEKLRQQGSVVKRQRKWELHPLHNGTKEEKNKLQ